MRRIAWVQPVVLHIAPPEGEEGEAQIVEIDLSKWVGMFVAGDLAFQTNSAGIFAAERIDQARAAWEKVIAKLPKKAKRPPITLEGNDWTVLRDAVKNPRPAAWNKQAYPLMPPARNAAFLRAIEDAQGE